MKMKEIGSREGRVPPAPSPHSDKEMAKSPPVQYPVIPCIVVNDNVQYVADKNKNGFKGLIQWG